MFHSNGQLKFRDAPPLLTNGSAALKASRLGKINIILNLLFYSIKYFDHYFFFYFILFFATCILYSIQQFECFVSLNHTA